MSKYFDILQKFDSVIDCYEIVGEWEIWVKHDHIGHQLVKIKVKLGKDGQYHFDTSHLYKGTGQSGPYRMSRSHGSSVSEALDSAMMQLFMFFKKEDEDAKWILNEFY
ncbi:hypothetical protein BS614_04155 [Paenibacillus xylanexedens]|uniref:hypothetical protein n=1 Tax=Paenibacillus xylanexedens TaxID=528191 RepID=UPI0009388152|nr:hypothetical protein [Paenibacillus xylanexedens]APO43325.1 hypothetical protein BS614_04155 [Paenibacillus xylanexedens]